MISAYAQRFFGVDTDDVDPLVSTLIQLEEERQRRRIILIPSESYVPQPVRQALGSVFTNIYAEGYPPSQMVDNDEALLADLPQQLAYYRRYADRRFYKGADYVHFIETLAQRRAAACFASHPAADGEHVRAEDIFVNVQPLSGAAANLSVYDALMNPGDTLMGMDLFQGGHLTHGSQFNVSGKQYNVVSYGINKRKGKLDYDEIRELAETHHPRVIVAGYTSYPWAPDFTAFRHIADSVGAYLMADIAHPAGMVIAGVYPNPVGIADVVTFTTHKTLCGPRGACILTTDARLSQKIDQAVFPGLQGGPHTNKFAAMCVAFEIARSEAFCDLQRRIVDNAQALAKSLTDRDLGLAYGGTDTHLLLLDLKSVRHPNGQPLYGEVVARILELAGIVVNKNTIPGDTVTSLATGIRMGTPWATQRGMGPPEMDLLAECISRVVKGITPFTYQGMSDLLPRGKIDWNTLEEVKHMVDDLAYASQVEIDRGGSGYPHFCLLPRETASPSPLLTADGTDEERAVDGDTVLVDLSVGIVRVSGWRALPFLEDLCTADIAGLEVGQGTRSFLLDKDAHVIDDVIVWRYPSDERGRDSYTVLTTPENTDRAVSWMRGISDGYILFDDQDVWRKVRGPAKVEVVSGTQNGDRLAAIAVLGPRAAEMIRQVLGSAFPKELDAAGFRCARALYAGAAVTVSRVGYAQGDARYNIVSSPVALKAMCDALLRAGARPDVAPQARHALRQANGLPARWPDASEERDAAPYVERLPELFDLHKPYFVGQNKLSSPKGMAPPKPAFTWVQPTDAPLKRTPLYEEHNKLNAKIVPFAGWEMPVWYTRVGDEHRAVRGAAGLFDVGHMGTLEVSGSNAADFLDAVTVNYVRWLKDGDSQYSALLDADGHILDDIIVYRCGPDRFFVVVNAANFDKDWAWLNAVNRNEVLLDMGRPWIDIQHPVRLRDLKDPSSGPDRRMDVALQGPNALQIVLACVTDPALRTKLHRLERSKFIEGEIGGIDLLISRTGYTGEEMGFELYVHPDRAVDLWRTLLEQGAPYGIAPCGLAARDSTRIEAGLPLYGHELAGPLDVTQTEAEFGAYVKYHKPFFVGRTPYKAYHDRSARQIVRFSVSERGARALRGGEHGEPVVNRRGRVIGTVTSCALVGERQIGMALVEARYAQVGTELLVYPEAKRTVSKVPQEFDLGDTVALPVRAEVLSRFLER